MASSRQNWYPRFDTWQRVEHALLILSFSVLSITGLPQKFPDAAWGDLMIRLMGGIEITRLIHHVAAALLIVETVYHGVIVGYKLFVRRIELTMLPGLQDVKDAFFTLAHNVGLREKPPHMGRYTFGEKVEYWAVIWGTAIMILTGFMLWNPIAVSRFLPGSFIPAAKAAHGGEALLAVLSIITWHVYNVHIKHFNRSMFSGRISHHEMVEEHPAELDRLLQGAIKPPPSPTFIARRQRIFMPVAVIASLIMLVGIYLFLTFEQTAITTVPRQSVEVFTPATPMPDN